MAQKKLEKGSQYEKYDLDGDGIVTDEEFEMDQKLIRCTTLDGMVCPAWYVVVSIFSCDISIF